LLNIIEIFLFIKFRNLTELFKNGTKLEQYDLIKIKTATFFQMMYIPKNEILKRRLTQIGFDEFSYRFEYLVYPIYQKLFKLRYETQIKIDNFVNKIRNNKSVDLICAQIRMGDNDGSHSLPYNDIFNFFNLIKNKLIFETLPERDYRVYITSDRDFVQTHAVNYFGEDKVVNIERHDSYQQSIHLDKDESNINDEKCYQYEAPIVSFHLLQYCDKIVVSHSAFGILGAMNRFNDPFKEFYIYTSQALNHNPHGPRKKLSFYKYNDFTSFNYVKT
jgi:hypothetical protein